MYWPTSCEKWLLNWPSFTIKETGANIAENMVGRYVLFPGVAQENNLGRRLVRNTWKENVRRTSRTDAFISSFSVVDQLVRTQTAFVFSAMLGCLNLNLILKQYCTVLSYDIKGAGVSNQFFLMVIVRSTHRWYHMYHFDSVRKKQGFKNK